MIDWIDLGICDYHASIKEMQRRKEAIISDSSSGAIYLVQYEATYTVGRNFNAKDIKNGVDILSSLIHSDRGGGITYHSLGQRLIYPVVQLSYFNINSIRQYVNLLQLWVANALSDFHIHAQSVSQMPGLWVRHGDDMAKIAFLGVKISHGVSYHGIAVNVANDVSGFNKISPCGIECQVVSANSLSSDISLADFDRALVRYNPFYR
ncbi:lipoyl(octanoyl) transferase LipB [Candidatus Sarmatiella mevalonica]|uniref:lipoyl(octanoyl) transferase LipB n=1 Tax=Candidatus Sarmatiella mevalonica TaxID=2770581 RepID=UPI0019247761|nr:lipoyl(octanoyl) transferase LipB [Candidatus Sarmatiella mevalonica]